MYVSTACVVHIHPVKGCAYCVPYVILALFVDNKSEGLSDIGQVRIF